MGTGGSFPGGKARPGRDADHSPPSSAEVKKEWELYLLSPRCACMERKGDRFTIPYINDLLPAIHTLSEPIISADDTSVINSSKNVDEFYTMTNMILSYMSN
jgi:hypothetical protein